MMPTIRQKIQLPMSWEEGTDVLIAIEYELAMRCRKGQAMTERLLKTHKTLVDILGLSYVEPKIQDKVN